MDAKQQEIFDLVCKAVKDESELCVNLAELCELNFCMDKKDQYNLFELFAFNVVPYLKKRASEGQYIHSLICKLEIIGDIKK